MQPLKLHIVSFDIPYPPDYGGAIDVFYKIKNLSEAGVEIYLHCPVYGGRQPSDVLEQLCKKVWYYPRKTSIGGLSLFYPYTVYSRRSKMLLRNLIEVDAPILFDGVSASFYLNHHSLKGRVMILRNQNVEQDYFRLLGLRESNLLKKIYYLVESRLLKNYENNLGSADAFFTVALHDHEFFKDKYPRAVHLYIPSFQPYDDVKSQPGTGKYAAYHGNLGLAENKEAVVYLLKNIIPHIEFPFLIAGRNPDAEIQGLVKNIRNCDLVANPSMEQMERIISEAQIQVLPTFQNTGLKLKLLHALFNGRHVVVNDEMVHGTGIESACSVAHTSDEMIRLIEELKDQPLEDSEIVRRKKLLHLHYDNKSNAEKIVTYLRQISP